MPSAHANTSNTSQSIDKYVEHGTVSCSVEYITDASANALADISFVEVECAMGGNFVFTYPGTLHHDVIKLEGTNADKVCTVKASGNNLRDGVGTDANTTLHMEILRDMYDTGAVRPTATAINASFTGTSITTFRTTLYGAINHALKSYIESRFEDASNNQFTPTIEAKTNGTTIAYEIDPDGTEHGHMFLINLLNTSNQTMLLKKISNSRNESISVATLVGGRRMVMGLKVTTTGGFRNQHEYAVGVNFV
jgi:hypothetical protein